MLRMPRRAKRRWNEYKTGDRSQRLNNTHIFINIIDLEAFSLNSLQIFIAILF
jgi:hypothetical protein